MRKYDILLADADNTLLDFTSAERTALTSLLTEFGVRAEESLLSSYAEHNDRMWKKLERGELSHKELSEMRFRTFFADHGIKGDGMLAEKRYRSLLSLCAPKTDGAEELLLRCRGKVRVYIISNGRAEVQISRFKLSGISDLADGVFLSDLIGSKKPEIRFFEAAASSIDNFSREKALVYGDSLSADIAGGFNYGIDTCWYNPLGCANGSGIVPVYEIGKHSDLYSILDI